MKRDDVVLPPEQEKPQHLRMDLVKEGMHHYYNRDPDALRRLLERLQRLLQGKEPS